jgi:CO dehydrogenase/acetyl-CoA synthase beta subunit
MSTSNKAFCKQYARSSYISKINPEFEGMARRYYNEKKQHEKVHTVKAKLDKEVAYIERMEKSLVTNLQKKEKELEFAKEISNRLAADLKRVRIRRCSESCFSTTNIGPLFTIPRRSAFCAPSRNAN